LEYIRKNQKASILLVVVITFIICCILFVQYKPNAYEIKMNGEYTFYVKDKGVFEEHLKRLQKELSKSFEGFKFEDRFTWSAICIDSKYIYSYEEIKGLIISNSKSKFKEIKKEVKNESNDLKLEAKAATKVVSNKEFSKKSATKKITSSNKSVLGSKTKLLRPSEGKVSSNFGMRWGKMHKGMDIAGSTGSPIYAAMDGTVTYSGWMEGYGKVIIIDHGNKLETIYGHCNLLRVKKGEKVSKGQRIGDVGSTGRSTGPHVHFEVRINGVAENPSKYI
jgi:murein DD-endopeptidase MepM/ murein hydrolase activator NlpD